MAIRTRRSLIAFERAFTLRGLDERQPTGTYGLGVNEKQSEGLSFTVCRRIATLPHLPAVEPRAGRERVVAVDPDDMKVAQERDAAV